MLPNFKHMTHSTLYSCHLPSGSLNDQEVISHFLWNDFLGLPFHSLSSFIFLHNWCFLFIYFYLVSYHILHHYGNFSNDNYKRVYKYCYPDFISRNWNLSIFDEPLIQKNNGCAFMGTKTSNDNIKSNNTTSTTSNVCVPCSPTNIFV